MNINNNKSKNVLIIIYISLYNLMALQFLSDGDISKDSAINTVSDPGASIRSVKSNIKTLVEGDTQSIINKYKDRIPPSESEKLAKKVNKKKITYHFPWLLYFYPNPQLDPNYILLDPLTDLTNLNKTKKIILGIIFILLLLYFISIIIKSEALLPSAYTAIFFIGRYLTIIALFFLFMLIYKLVKIIPWISRMIGEYLLYTVAPLRKPEFNRTFYKDRSSFGIKETDYIPKFILYVGATFIYGFTTFLLLILLCLIISPAIIIAGCLFGMLLGKLSYPLNNFGVGFFDYEVNKVLINTQALPLTSGALKTFILFIVLIIIGIMSFKIFFKQKEKTKKTDSTIINNEGGSKSSITTPQPAQTAPTTFDIFTNIVS